MRIVLVMLAVLAPLAGLSAQPATQADPAVERVFTAIERAIIEGYYRDRDAVEHGRAGKSKDKGLPPGLAKRDRLPPGLEKQLERNGRLPPGLEKRNLPPDLAGLLGPRDDGAVPQVVGADVVLVEAATQIILDVLHGVIVGAD